MSDAVDRGITVTELAPMEQAIDVSPDSMAAFVGRALRGPLNEPVLIRDFGEFRRRFGGIWSRSSLGPAVQQFFEHGGRQVYVVRVANSARGAMLCLPASGSALVLRAVEPGSTEQIRAAVDYDRVEDDEELFNLTLQRIDPESGHVIDQETFRRADYREGTDSFIADLLLTSSLARIEHPWPSHRPEATQGLAASLDNTYATPTQEGADGRELSDYDLIGSRRDMSGMFALQQVERFDLLYLPPPGKYRDLGPVTLLAAEMLCRERGAVLIMDPPGEWTTPAEAVAGVRYLGLASPNTIGYFPRMRPRKDEDATARAVGGALAGLLCKLDSTYGCWQSLDQQGMGFSRDLVAAFDVGNEDSRALAREGLNLIAKGPAGRARLRGSVTLGCGGELNREFSSLAVRRLCLRIVNAIDHGTRWAVFYQGDARVADTIRSQVTAYLSALADMGAFEHDRFAVECDTSPPDGDDRVGCGVTILVVFHPLGCKEPVSFTLYQASAGCRVASTAFAPTLVAGTESAV